MTSPPPFDPHAEGRKLPKPVRHSANPPPVNQQQLEEGHDSASRAGSSSGPIQDTPAGQRLRASLSSEIGRPAGED